MRAFGLITLTLAATPVLAATPAAPGDQLIHARYQCEGEVAFEAVFINTAADNRFAVVALDGRAILLSAAVSASGARYLSAPAEDGAQYQFWTKGAEATLSTLAGDVETVLLADCAQQ